MKYKFDVNFLMWRFRHVLVGNGYKFNIHPGFIQSLIEFDYSLVFANVYNDDNDDIELSYDDIPDVVDYGRLY